MRTTKLLVTVAAVAALAACGGDDDAASTPPTENASTTTTATTAPPQPTVAVTTTTITSTTEATTTTAPPSTIPATTVPPTTQPPENGTRNNPIPIGEFAPVGEGWELRVNSVNLDAAQAVLDANRFNDPPAEGNVYVLVDVTARYDGDDDSSSMGVSVNVLGRGTNVTIDRAFAAMDQSYDSNVEVFQGGETSGAVVFEVSPADLDSLVLIGEAYFAWDDDARAFFALS